MDDLKLKSIIEKYERENPEPYSLISLNYILFHSPLEELIQFSIENTIKKVDENTENRNEVVYRILDQDSMKINTPKKSSIFQNQGKLFLNPIKPTVTFNDTSVYKSEKLR